MGFDKRRSHFSSRRAIAFFVYSIIYASQLLNWGCSDMPMDKVIRWKLNEVMARKRVRNKDLAETLGITENSVYRLRKVDEMPRLTPERLNGICQALDCQPGELLEYVPNDDDGKLVSIVEVA
ncbi:helix-turn-helix domain-containing protein [Anabaena azotica]|uniref:helix-turn-helix domain-containing protein n=1 Tax=Anabaena azotica TaxID=197653 RepID=UPI0039A64428